MEVLAPQLPIEAVELVVVARHVVRRDRLGGPDHGGQGRDQSGTPRQIELQGTPGRDIRSGLMTVRVAEDPRT